MASARLVRLARAAAKATAKAAAAQQAWAEAFEAEYGHCDISDVLVSAIDYAVYGGESDSKRITAEFIEENSKAGSS